MTAKEEGMMRKMVKEKNSSLQEIEKRFSKISKEELARNYEMITQSLRQGEHEEGPSL